MSLFFAIGISPSGNTPRDLDNAIASVNASGGTLDLSVFPLYELTNQVRALQSNPDFTFSALNIVVSGLTEINGLSQIRGFFIGGDGAAPTNSVTIQNVNFSRCVAGGGDGNASGGGGMGGGGGVYVSQNCVGIVDNCSFTNCSAFGGTGGTFLAGPIFGGGGGLGGNGGRIEVANLGGGGGGFGGNGNGGGGGCSGFDEGNAQGNTPGNNFGNSGAAGTSGVGGMGIVVFGENGGYGGGGGTNTGAGGRYGGGADGGNGDFGGGGGGTNGLGGNAGFGGGGGGVGTPGFGGAIPIFGTQGGGGAGFGGALFLEPSTELTLMGQISFSGSEVAAGKGGIPSLFGALGTDIFMMSSSTLTFSTANNLTLKYPIESDQGAGGGATNTGGLVKNGSALLSIPGLNSYTGSTTVVGGELHLTGSIITGVDVQAAATLSGNFSTSGSITSTGTVAPRNKMGHGVINIGGNYTQTGGNLIIDLTGAQSDQLLVGGSATLNNPTLTLVVNNGNYPVGTQYVVINSPTTLNGSLTVVKTGPLADQVQLQVDISSLIVTVIASPFTPIIPLHQVIDLGIPTIVNRCINCCPIIPGSDFATVVDVLGGLSDKQVNEALITLSGVQFGAIELVNERNNSYVADLISQHLFQLCCSPRDCCNCQCDTEAWVTVFGNIMENTKAFDNLRPFDANAVGAVAGLDFCCGPCFYWGGSVGYTHTHLIWRHEGGKGNLNSYYGALYGSWLCSCYSVDASVIGGGTDYELDRRIVFGSIDRVAKSRPWSYFVTAHLGLKGDWSCGCLVFQPYVLGDYHYFTRQGFKEKGAASIDLKVRSKDQSIVRAEGGMRVFAEAMDECYCFAPYLGLSYVGEFPLHKSKQKTSFVDRDCLMKVTSYDSTVNLASPQAGVKWTWCNGVSFTLGYKGLFNHKTHINEIEGRFEWLF